MPMPLSIHSIVLTPTVVSIINPLSNNSPEFVGAIVVFIEKL